MKHSIHRKMEFLVSDAERLFAEGGKVRNLSFWGYKIMTRSTLPAFQSPPLFPRVVPAPAANFIAGEGYVDFCTWHRYSDFEWLIVQLEHAFPGKLFPPIPDKEMDGTKDKLSDLISSKETEHSRENLFVQKRIRQLQLFFDVLTKMPEVHEHEIIRAFVTMEEPEWLQYKEKLSQQVKPSGWDGLKSKGLGLLSKLSSIGDKKPVAFCEGSHVATLRAQQQQIGDSLRACFCHMAYLQKYGHYEPNITNKEESAKETLCAKPLSEPLVYNGHFVCDVSDVSTQGVVRHVEGPTAWVDWGRISDSGAPMPLSRIPISQLCYPPSGVSDPTIFAAQEIASQVDSFCMYLSYRPESRQLERLMDLLWFWSRYSLQVVHVTQLLQELLEELTIGEKELSKKKDGAEKIEMAARVAVLKNKFDVGCGTIQAHYGSVFRPLQQKALLDIAFLYGTLSVSFLGDEEWEQRLQRADAALPLLFEPPQEVVETLTMEAKASQFVEYQMPQVLMPQQQYVAVAPPVVAAQPPASPLERDSPVSPTPSPVTPATVAVVASAPPVEDEVPPPPPPPQETRPHAYSGMEDNWQRPRQWNTEETGHVDFAPPPPPVEE